MIITEDFNIWEDDHVPVVVINSAPKETKEFQIWIDSNVPLVDIYDTAGERRRVFMF